MRPYKNRESIYACQYDLCDVQHQFSMRTFMRPHVWITASAQQVCRMLNCCNTSSPALRLLALFDPLQTLLDRRIISASVLT